MNIAILAFLAANAMRPGGDMRDVSMRPPQGASASASVTIDAMPYTRTVACDAYTLTGTATGVTTDASAASTSLLLKMSGSQNGTTFTDQSATPKTMSTVGDAKIDTVTRKFGSGAYLGDGTGDYLTTPDSVDFTLGSGAFTFELWVWMTASTGFPSFITQTTAAGTSDSAFYFGYNSSEKFKFGVTSDGVNFTQVTSTTDVTQNQWFHLAAVRSGNTIKLYVNGVEEDSETFAGSVWDSASSVTIGTAHTGCGSCPLNGRMDDVRITKGVARYTGNFTPPGELPPEEVWWSASPSSTISTCTGTATWSCVVDVDPDATGEGVETITVTSGSATDTETLGFYVDGEHSCFLAQNVDGDYNSTLADLDAVATWMNVGSSALDVTQATGAAQPTFRTSIVGGQPVVRCDGGDRVAATTASDWTFLYQGADFTVDMVTRNTTGGTGVLVSTMSADATHGMTVTTLPANIFQYIFNATPTQNVNLNRSGYSTSLFHWSSTILDDNGGAGVDWFSYLDGGAVVSSSRASTYSVTTASSLTVCAFNGGAGALNGDLFRTLIYQSALTSTQRGINKAVDEWALGASLPVTP